MPHVTHLLLSSSGATSDPEAIERKLFAIVPSDLPLATALGTDKRRRFVEVPGMVRRGGAKRTVRSFLRRLTSSLSHWILARLGSILMKEEA